MKESLKFLCNFYLLAGFALMTPLAQMILALVAGTLQSDNRLYIRLVFYAFLAYWGMLKFIIKSYKLLDMKEAKHGDRF